jgi:phosphoribosylamine---glycine ligase
MEVNTPPPATRLATRPFSTHPDRVYKGLNKSDADRAMNVLILGSGAREHALAWACAKSPMTRSLLVAPGNPGCASIARTVPMRLEDHAGIVAFCRTESIDLVVIGPEGPLVSGLADDLMAADVLCFGPTREAAKLEGSKGYAKDFCCEFGIPTGAYRRFNDQNEAKAYLRRLGAPVVVKADGLAAGKGVIVAKTLEEAETAVDSLLSGSLGAAIVIEEFLNGEEVSFFALCDGRTALPFASAQDHKRVGDGDTGPNTGGMGAYSPPPVMTPELSQKIMREVVGPTLRGMNERGSPFRGVLFAGLMIEEQGPKVIEFNVRFGDPEAEVILPRLEDDLLPLLVACANGTLRSDAPRFSSDVALSVVMAARGYPGEPVLGSRISGIEDAEASPGVVVFHGGTREVDGALFANGGRVLAITALGGNVAEAHSRAYAAVDRLKWPEGFCRRDIGWRAIARESK